MVIIKSIKAKKEFSSLPDEFIQEKLNDYFTQHATLQRALEKNEYNEKSKEYKQVVKEIRASLRETYGVFQRMTNDKRKRLLDEYFSAHGRGAKLKIIDALLSSHQSTKERKDHYQDIYNTLFDGNPPKHVLDLGCGFNPLTYHWIPGSPTYTCCDISEQDMAIMQAFFDRDSISGSAYACNLLDKKALTNLRMIPADTVLLLKLVDTLESQERNASKAVIKALTQNKHVKRIIISFPQKSIGGRPFRSGSQDNWFTSFLREQSLTWGHVIIGDEEFYDVSNH